LGYVIGVDAGGTKTEIIFHQVENAFSEEGANPLSFIGEGANPQVIGYSKVKVILKELIEKGFSYFNLKREDILGIGIGLAGVDRPDERQQLSYIMNEIMTELNLTADIPCAISNDAEIALLGSLPSDKHEGIIVISGTGSIAYGINHEGNRFRSGGWGHILGDEGSGYEIGLQGLKSVCRSVDQREEETILTKLILDHLKLKKVSELIPYVYFNNLSKREIAEIAKFVVEAKDKNDFVANKILTQAVHELVLLVRGLVQQSTTFNPDTFITTSGSIFKHSRFVKNLFEEEIKKNQLGRFYDGSSSAVVGAVKLALQELKNKKLV
jgi:N-acetylglucosamine kinase-like BadF-type ATPase